MTTTQSGSGRARGLFAAGGVLAATGCTLVVYAMPSGDRSAPSVPLALSSAHPAQTRSSSDTGQPASEGPGADEVSPAPAASTASPPVLVEEEVLPEPGAGPRADPLVQGALDRAIPADLPAEDERQLSTLGRAVWMAEITGAGRSKWPAYFPESRTVAAYSRVRIQGLIARSDSEHPADAALYLVWAGADPSGTFLDGRTATLRFARQGQLWTPVR
ncbi:hypothetical protein [Streptomyces sp. NPDC060022]|uniref:hypothetical protein n=1 Tax=Streptomyces sp. NPDC060022 TaxID=3347039 RepID=UPI0036CC5DD7